MENQPVPHDTIFIRELEVFCKVGCTTDERAFPQRLLISVEVMCDTRNACASDDLNDTVCYVGIADTIRDLAASEEWALVEKMGDDFAAKLFAAFASISSLRLQIAKFVIPGAACAGIEIYRSRAAV